MFTRLVSAFFWLTATSILTIANAGTFYTDQASFDAAVASLTLEWSENFEGLSAGVLPSGPVAVGSGQAEIFTNGPQEVYLQTNTGNLAYWNIEDGLDPPTTIRGPASAALSASAISFNYNMGGVGNNIYVASFISSSGTESIFLTETSVSYPNGEGGQDVPLFLGWVGAPGESLQQIVLAPPATGILVDNFRAYEFVGAAAQVDVAINDAAGRTLAVIRNFMSQRADLMTSHDPLLTPHLNGASAGVTNDAVNFTAGSVSGALELAFSTSLSQIAQAQKTKRTAKRPAIASAMVLGYAEGSSIGGHAAPRLDIWLMGTFAHYRDTGGGVQEDGTFGLLFVGGEYKVAPGMLLGLLVQFDWTDEEDDRTAIGAEGEGWMLGPYMVARPAERLYFQARAAWGTSDNDVSPFGTYSDSFDTTRWLASAKIKGRFRDGPWRVSPIGSLMYFKDRQDSYTDAVGNVIPSQTVSLGRVTFGPEIAYTKEWGEVRRLELFTGMTGIWDFDVEDRVVSGLVVGSNELRAKLTAGATWRGTRGINLNASGFFDGIGSEDFEAYGGKVEIGLTLN